MTRIQCETCKQVFAMPPNFAIDVEAVETLAEGTHAGSGIVCGQPLLTVMYVPSLISEELGQRFDSMMDAAKENEGKLVLTGAKTNGPH